MLCFSVALDEQEVDEAQASIEIPVVSFVDWNIAQFRRDELADCLENRLLRNPVVLKIGLETQVGYFESHFCLLLVARDGHEKELLH